jgi:hypothetical protein
MKRRLLAFIKRLLPRCGAQIFKGDSYTMQEWRYGWGDPHCTRPKWHKGPHFWLSTGHNKPRYEKPRLYKRPRYWVSRANSRAESGAKGED